MVTVAVLDGNLDAIVDVLYRVFDYLGAIFLKLFSKRVDVQDKYICVHTKPASHLFICLGLITDRFTEVDLRRTATNHGKFRRIEEVTEDLKPELIAVILRRRDNIRNYELGSQPIKLRLRSTRLISAGHHQSDLFDSRYLWVYFANYFAFAYHKQAVRQRRHLFQLSRNQQHGRT